MTWTRVPGATISLAVVGVFVVALGSMAALWWMTVIGMALWLLAVSGSWRPRSAGQRWLEAAPPRSETRCPRT